MRKILIFAVAAFGTYANAATDGTTGTVKSEYFYQTDANTNQATPALGYTSQTTKPKTAGTKAETTKTTLNVNYERGINEMFSAGGSIGYVNGKSDTTVDNADTTGLDDIRFFGKGNYSFMTGSSLNYGATVNWSLGDREIKADSMSANTGGAAITPYIGYQMLMGSSVIGTKLQTAMDITKSQWKDKRSTAELITAGSGNLSGDVSGGQRTTLTGFYEMMASGATWGGEVGWFNDTPTKLDLDAGGKDKSAGESGYTLAAYTRWDVSEGATIVGRVNYESAITDHNDIDSSNLLGLNIGGRFSF